MLLVFNLSPFSTSFAKGSYMRMSLHDFYKYVLRPDSFEPDPEVMRADSALAGEGCVCYCVLFNNCFEMWHVFVNVHTSVVGGN